MGSRIVNALWLIAVVSHRGGSISLRPVDHSLFVHPAQKDQLKNNLPAYTVGSLRANVQVECLVDVIDDLVSSDDPQDKMKRFTKALHEVFAFSRSKNHMSSRQLG